MENKDGSCNDWLYYFLCTIRAETVVKIKFNFNYFLFKDALQQGGNLRPKRYKGYHISLKKLSVKQNKVSK